MSWTDERIDLLKSMWDRGLTATQIAEELGGVSRNAVIGKAHRLGMPSRPSPTHVNDAPIELLESPAMLAEMLAGDPIVDVLGASVHFEQLTAWRWPEDDSYLAPEVTEMLLRAGWRSDEETERADYLIVGVEQFLGAVVASALEQPNGFLGALGVELNQASYASAEAEEPVDPDDMTTQLLIGWDLVYAIAEASRIRRHLVPNYAPIRLTHMVAAAMAWREGQQAIAMLENFGGDFTDFREVLTRALARGSAPNTLADYVERLPDLGNAHRHQAEYISDRAEHAFDALGTDDDARALASLMVLEAAAPPLAIGIFGAWGTGKSTLLSQIQREVRQQVASEAALLERGGISEPDTRRVARVIQVSLNAWTFADSENLWASITSEIFDQIASGGHDRSQADRGARLIAEVTQRTSEETEQLRVAIAAHKAGASGIETAERRLENAKSALTASIAEALAGTTSALLGEAEKPEAKTASKQEESALAALREAVTDGSGTISRAALERYTASASDMSRLALAAWHLARRAGWKGAGLCVISVLALVAAVTFAILCQSQILSISAWLFSLLPVVTIFAVAAPLAPFLLPAWRIASVFRRELRSRRDKAEAEVEAAEADLRAQRATLAKAAEARTKYEAFVQKYGALSEGSAAGAPGLMLEYLLRDSVDVGSVRAKLGLLAVVRRCFDQLNAIIRVGETSGTKETVQRIIVYIDDLDRCTEAQVVAVLQAVHLLLAYDCFIAVVAVDASWLKHSLEKVHDPLSDGKIGLIATDYLEKIFQIPFWVRPMAPSIREADADYRIYRRFVSAMVGAGASRQNDGTLARDGAPRRMRTDAASLTLERIAPFAPETAPVPPSRLVLSPAERRVMLGLGPIAAKSPRAVKRMINLYRLIRASLGARDLEAFQRGGNEHVPSFRAVQLVLAIEVGLPANTALALFEGLSNTSDENWVHIVESLGAPGRVQISVKEPDWLSTLAHCGKRVAFLTALRAVSGSEVISLDDIRLARRIVERYSFHRCAQ